MTIEAFPRCPYTKSGRHELSVILPESSEYPSLLFCSHCGMARHHTLTLPAPLDDLPSDAIAKLVGRGR